MTPRWLALALAAAASAAAGAPAAPPRPVDAVVEQPRPFGHAVGDLLTQRVLLQHDGERFEPATLPPPGRIGAWLERRGARIEHTPDRRPWLVIEYQLINAPQALRTITLPAWELKPREPGPALAVAAWHLSVAPLTPERTFGFSGLGDPLADRAPPLAPVDAMRRRAGLGAGAALLVLLAWAGWWGWRQARARADQPFARAWRELRALDDAAPAAWAALHRAFDRTAGRVTQPATLPALFRRAPHLEPLRADIERFYAQSQALFFGAAEAPPTLSPRALCRALRRIEKRHEP